MMVHQVDFLLIEASTQQVGQFDEVCNVLVNGQRRFRVQRRVGLAAAALLPDDDHEMLLQFAVEAQDACRFAGAGTAGEEEQDRLVYILSADDEPLIHAAEFDLLQRGDAAGQGLPVRAGDGGGVGGPLRTDDDRRQ